MPSARLLASLFVTLWACGCGDGGASARRPQRPEGGFSLRRVEDVDVEYSDRCRTRGDLVLPAVARRWPLVVLVHASGSERAALRDEQDDLARQGYAVWAYDVRGQGDALRLNPERGMTLYGGAETCDLAEQIAFVRRRFATDVDGERVAVTGSSQGGIHAWLAAAWSGRELRVPGRAPITFPRVAAVAAFEFVADFRDHALRGGTLFERHTVERFLGHRPTVHYDAATAALGRRAFLEQDPEALARAWREEPGRAVEPLLATTTVPILWCQAWLDGLCAPLPALDALASLPGATPWRALLSTGGHGSPDNVPELLRRRELRLRWLDRFVWGNEEDAVAREPRFALGVPPLDDVELRARDSRWQRWEVEALPPRGFAMRRSWLSPEGQLGSEEPAPATVATIVHAVAEGFTPEAFAAQPELRTTAAVLRHVPPSAHVFAAAPLATAVDVCGVPRVSLQVVPDAERFTVCAALRVRPGSAAAASRQLSIWARGVLHATPGEPMRLAFDLPPCVATLPAGSVVELLLQNHWLPDAPQPREHVTVPWFVSSRVRIEAGSWLELPFGGKT